MKISVAILLTLTLGMTLPKSYVYTYFDSGITMSSGWLQGNEKIGFWRFFHENGQLKSKGEFDNNSKNKYWSYFYNNTQIKKNGNYNNGKKNG